MNYDKILEAILLADSKEEIDEILRCAINKMREACAEISDEEKTEFVLKLMNLRKRLGITKELTTVGGLRALVKGMPAPEKSYKKLSNNKSKNSKSLYGLFTTENQFFIAEEITYGNDRALENMFNSERYVYDHGSELKSFEGVWPSRSEKINEKYYVVKLSKIIGAECSNPYTAYLKCVLDYVNKYLLTDPDFVKNAFQEDGEKILIKRL